MNSVNEAALSAALDSMYSTENDLNLTPRDRVRMMLAAASRTPDDWIHVPVDCLQDLANDAEAYVKSTEFRPSRAEQKMESVYTARGLLAARQENK